MSLASNKLVVTDFWYEIFVHLGTGAVNECGVGRGKYFAVNVPLKDGVNNEMYIEIFDRLVCI